MVELDHNDVVLINRVEANVDFQSVIDRFFSEGDLVAWISTELRNLKSEKRSKLLKFNLDRQLLSMDWHSAVHNKSRLSREVKGEGSAGWDFSTMKPVADFREVKKKQDRLLKELEDARREVRETKARMDKNKSENLQFMAECDSRQEVYHPPPNRRRRHASATLLRSSITVTHRPNPRGPSSVGGLSVEEEPQEG
jgi:hypothetical protein